MIRDSNIDIALSRALRLGLFLSFVTTLVGAVVLYWQSGSEVVDYSIFLGEPDTLKHMKPIVISAFQGEGLAIVQLGTLLMIATPVSRVFLCVVIFLYKKDYLYVLLSGFVLAVLLYSFFE